MMESFDWKSPITNENELLEHDPETLLHHIASNGGYQKIVDLMYEAIMPKYLLPVLRIPRVRKNIFTGYTAEKIIKLLDITSDDLRFQIFSIMLDNFDSHLEIQKVANDIFYNINVHSWAIKFLDFLAALMPNEVLQRAFVKKINTTGNQYDDLKACFDDSPKGYSLYFGSHVLPNIRLVSQRGSFGKIVAELYINELKSLEYDNEYNTRETCSHLMSMVIHFHPIWSTFPEIKQKLKEAVLAYPAAKDILFSHSVSYAFNNQLHNISPSYFNIYHFNQWEFIDYEYIMREIILKRLYLEATYQIKISTNLESIITYIPMNLADYSKNFLNMLKTMAKVPEEKELSLIWPKIVQMLPEYTLKQVLELNNFNLFKYLIKLITPKSKPEQIGLLRNEGVFFSFDLAMKCIVFTIEGVLAAKEKIISVNMNQYTDKLADILDSLLLDRRPWETNRCLVHMKQNTPFYMIEPALRDKVLIEYIKHPAGDKPLNYSLATQSMTVTLALSLLFSNISLIAEVLVKGKGKPRNSYGFISNANINFPPLPTSDTKKAIPYEAESMHVFELTLIREHLLTHADNGVAMFSYTLYQLFLLKVCKQVIADNNIELAKEAIQIHFRFCRMMLGKQKDEIKQTIYELFERTVCCPIVLAAAKIALPAPDLLEHLENNLFSLVSNAVEGRNPLFSVALQIISTGKSYFSNIDDIQLLIVQLLIQQYVDAVPNSVKPIFQYQQPLIFNELSPLYSKKHSFILDQVVQHSLPSLYMTLLIKSGLLKKGASPYRYPAFDKSIFDPSIYEAFSSNSYTLNGPALLCFIRILNKSVLEYTDIKYKNPLTTFIPSAYAYIDQIIRNYASNITFAAYKIPDIQALSEVVTLAQYQQTLSTCNFQYVLTDHTKDVFLSIMPKSNPLYQMLEADNNSLQMLFNILNFKPTDPATRPAYYREPVPTLYSIVAKLTALPDLTYEPFYQNSGKCPSKNKFETPWINSFAQTILEPIFKLDAADLTKKLLNQPEHLYSLVGIILKFIHSFDPSGVSFDLLAHILKALFEDVLVEDPKPTEQDPAPAPAHTIFTGVAVALPHQKAKRAAPARRPVRGKKPVEKPKQVGQARYAPNVYLMAVISKILRKSEIVNRFDHAIILEPMIKMLSLPQESLSSKVGLDNQHKFTNQLSELVISLARFGNEIQPLTWYTQNKTPQVQAIVGLLGTDVFTHSAAAALFEKLVGFSSYEQRHALITSLISVVQASHENDKILLSLAFRIKIISWCMCPRVVGSPLPQYSIEFVQRLSKFESLHLDVRRAIISNSVAYFQYQSKSNSGPYHFDELFQAMMELYNNAKDSLTPIFCKIVSPSICERVVRTAKIFTELLPPLQDPSNYIVFNTDEKIEMPSSGPWAELEPKFTQHFIGSGLLAQNQAVLQLTVHLLTEICVRGGEVSKNIAPFITKSLKRFDPSCGFISLISFSFSFCFLPFHQEFTECIDEFINTFAKTRAHIDTVNKNQVNNYLKSKTQGEAYTPLTTVINEFRNCFDNVVNRALNSKGTDKGLSIEVASKLAQRICVAMNFKKRTQLVFSPYENLKHSVEIAASNSYVAAALNGLDDAATTDFSLVIALINENYYHISKTTPSYLQSVFNYFTYNIDESHFDLIDSMDDEVSSIPTIRQFLSRAIINYFNTKYPTSSPPEDLLAKASGYLVYQ